MVSVYFGCFVKVSFDSSLVFCLPRTSLVIVFTIVQLQTLYFFKLTKKPSNSKEFDG